MTVNDLITQLDLMPADAIVVFLEDGSEVEEVTLASDGDRVVLGR